MEDWGKEKKFVPSSELDRADAPPGARSDGVEDWGKEKKFVPSSELDRQDDGPQVGRSDRVADWGKEKREMPSRPFPEDDRPVLGRSDSVENWAKEKAKDSPTTGGPARAGWRDAPAGAGDRGRGDRDEWRRGSPGGSGSEEGGGAPAPAPGRPRLKLNPRSKEAAGAGAGAGKASSLFGEAKPREESLQAKGVDWKSTDSKWERAPAPTRANSGRKTAESTRELVGRLKAQVAAGKGGEEPQAAEDRAWAAAAAARDEGAEEGAAPLTAEAALKAAEAALSKLAPFSKAEAGGGRPGGAWGTRETGASDRESRWSKAPRRPEPRRGGARGPRGAERPAKAAAPEEPAAPEVDADGWETAGNKRRGGARANGKANTAA